MVLLLGRDGSKAKPILLKPPSDVSPATRPISLFISVPFILEHKYSTFFVILSAIFEIEFVNGGVARFGVEAVITTSISLNCSLKLTVAKLCEISPPPPNVDVATLGLRCQT